MASMVLSDSKLDSLTPKCELTFNYLAYDLNVKWIWLKNKLTFYPKYFLFFIFYY
jgi:hypothetical protein